MGKKSPPYKWTEQQISWLKWHAYLPRKERADRFNSYFLSDIPHDAINALCKRKGIKTGRTGRFEKGHKPSTMAKLPKGHSNAGSFKKREMPHNHLSVGSAIIDGDGYHKIKIAEPNVWEFVHRKIWEEHFGPIPKGYVVRFRDGNRDNLIIDNLILLSLAENIHLTRRGYSGLADEVKPVALTAYRLEATIFKRLKE